MPVPQTEQGKPQLTQPAINKMRFWTATTVDPRHVSRCLMNFSKAKFQRLPLVLRVLVHVVVFSVVAFVVGRTAGTVVRFLREERCIVRVPQFLQNAFVPPFNCSLCEGLTETPWIWANQTEQYRHWISRKEVPLVIRGAYRRTATSAPLTWETLKQLYSRSGNQRDFDAGENDNANIGYSANTCQFFGYNTEFRSLREAFAMSKERMNRNFYIGWSNCEPFVSERLRSMYRVPDFLPADSERSALEWFFVGNRGKGAHLHLDRLDKPSWQAQLSGIKRWTFKALPECHWTCKQITADLHAGDVIMLDSSVWYHKTEVISEELSIAIGSEYD